MKYQCDLIRDLLPLYHDSICSEPVKVAVEEHCNECLECRQYYKKMCDSDVVEVMSYDNAVELQKADSLKNVKKKMKRDSRKTAIIVAIVAVILHTLFVLGIIGFLGLGFLTAEVEVHSGVRDYNKYMGEEADEEYRSKWGMDEAIFPKEISEEMDVLDYKMVYYNPFDAQYLSYLVVSYEEADYAKEMERLSNYNSTAYLGYYGVTGFDEKVK